MNEPESSTPPPKTCTKCGHEKPPTRDFFEWDKDRGRYRTHCRTCRNAEKNGRRFRKKPKRFDLESGLRTCSVCEQTFSATTEFFPPSQPGLSPDGVQSHCRPCVRARERDRHRRDPARRSNRDKEYRLANLEAVKAYQKRWRAENAEYVKESMREWRVAHPEYDSAKQAKRKARKLGNGGTHTATDIQAQYDRQKGKCFWCHKKVGKRYHVDHVIPLSKEGSNGPENLVVSCPTCNMVKHDKHPMDFDGRMF